MKKRNITGLDFIVDKLTNSIENVITGDCFATEISIITNSDLKLISKNRGWLFDWREEIKNPVRDVYKLSILSNPTIIQGLISLEIKPDHVFMHLVESAPFNKGKLKCIPGFREIWLHLHASFHFNADMKVMYRFCQNHS